MRGIHRLILEKKNAGCTIFLTTHNMEEAAKLCDIPYAHDGHADPRETG
jgi:ABC-type multidrug transport system ATPase subunit